MDATPPGNDPSDLQRRRLATLLDAVTTRDGFYHRKLAGRAFDPMTSPMSELPLTTRSEVEQDQRRCVQCGYHELRPTGAVPEQVIDDLARPVRWPAEGD